MIVLASEDTEIAAFYREVREKAEAEAAKEAAAKRRQSSPMASLLLGGLRGD